MIRLLVCDKEIFKDAISLDKITLNKMLAKQLIKSKIIIDLDAGRLDIRKLNSIIKRSSCDIDLRTAKEDRIQKVKHLVNKVLYYGKTEGSNIFHTLSLIFSNKNRKQVFNSLEREKPPLEVLLKWIISNLDENDLENINLINRIDQLLYYTERRIVHFLLSCFNPKYSPFMRFYYSFPTRGQNEK